jgi:RluA family pseudouridine synthase
VSDEESQALTAVFEDEWLLAVNKPRGWAVQPDLETAVKQRWGRGLVAYHRLDKDTTGVILFGKRPEIHRAMSEVFEKKKIRKAYFALVRGVWRPEWNKVESFVDRAADGRMQNLTRAETKTARHAMTTFRLLSTSPQLSWIEAMPKTGRTHQIRLHCLLKDCPILGDTLYGPERREAQLQSARVERVLALHAYRLDFTHPKTGESLRLIAPPPAPWQEWLAALPGAPAKLESLLRQSGSKSRVVS